MKSLCIGEHNVDETALHPIQYPNSNGSNSIGLSTNVIGTLNPKCSLPSFNNSK